jgi:hypothetical protein
VIAVISEMRREKNRAGISLNAPLKRAEVYAPAEQLGHIKLGQQDILDTLKIDELVLVEGQGGGLKVEGYPNIGFTVTA